MAGKIHAYIENRKAGLDPTSSARAAGYSMASVNSTTARLEARQDVRAALANGPAIIPLSKKQQENLQEMENHYDDPKTKKEADADLAKAAMGIGAVSSRRAPGRAVN